MAAQTLESHKRRLNGQRFQDSMGMARKKKRKREEKEQKNKKNKRNSRPKAKTLPNRETHGEYSPKQTRGK